MKTYTIHFIRHGETEETKQGAYIGTTNVPLSDKGRKALEKLDHNCKYPYAPVVFTSPLKRCLQTCQVLYPNVKPIVIDQLSECNFGLWEGKTAEELKGDPDFEKWLAGDTNTKPPKGESGAEFTRRVCNVFENIVEGLLKTGNTHCAVITHGGVIMTLLAVYGLPQAKPFEWTMDNGYGFSIRISPMLWQRDKVSEVYQQIPVVQEEDYYDNYMEDDLYEYDDEGDDVD